MKGWSWLGQWIDRGTADWQPMQKLLAMVSLYVLQPTSKFLYFLGNGRGKGWLALRNGFVHVSPTNLYFERLIWSQAGNRASITLCYSFRMTNANTAMPVLREVFNSAFHPPPAGGKAEVAHKDTRHDPDDRHYQQIPLLEKIKISLSMPFWKLFAVMLAIDGGLSNLMPTRLQASR